MSSILDVLLLATSWTHVLLAPYTKVEESFNLHAVHDVLMYGVRPDALQNYDHFVFPGAVPRTFIGSVLLAWAARPIIHLANYFEVVQTKFDLQLVVRLVLASANTVGFCVLRRGVARRFGGLAGVFFVLLTCTQFHLPFWMGRTLPNMFALLPVNLALHLLVNRAPNATRPMRSSTKKAIALLTFAAVVYRAEIALLLGPIVLFALLYNEISLTDVIKVGLMFGLSSMALTVAVDSYFWQSGLIWPELHSVWFNIVEGKSADWGISPFYTYATSLLPKLLLSALPLSILGFVADSRIRNLISPALVFIALISCIGHKEWRFIVYVIPLFNIAAARGAVWMCSRKKSTIYGQLCFLTVMGLLVCNCALTTILTLTSMANYPGGEALTRFNYAYAEKDYVHVHISNLAAQTGASLFLQTHAPPYPIDLGVTAPAADRWIYNKTEHVTPATLPRTVTYAIAETSNPPPIGWTVVDTVEAYKGWRLSADLKDILGRGIAGLGELPRIKMVKSEQLMILQRRR